MKVYRTEYPNPQFERENWLCLNGEWEFEIDSAKNGVDKKYFNRPSLNEKINVPFCPESELSGIGNTDFLIGVWYRKEITVPDYMDGKRVFLHFGAVDWKSTIYINGEEVCEHIGGYTPFSVEVTKFGKNFTVFVFAEDDNRYGDYASGKQATRFLSVGCFYTRVTGIWQSVWLEATGEKFIDSFRVTPCIDSKSAILEVAVKDAYGAEVVAQAFYEGKKQGEVSFKVTNGNARASLNLNELHLWELGKGRLYDLVLTLKYNGEVVDTVKSYFGMRSVCFEGKKFLLNGKSVFARLILDQGYYRDGIYTAPDVQRFIDDIKISMDLGYNGARLHQKVYEPLCLYYCDKMGYMVFDEYPDWGCNRSKVEPIKYMLPEWLEVIKRDYNHPSIVVWNCLNEVWDFGRARANLDLIRTIYLATKAADNTRPVIDSNGGIHTITDIFDNHDYDHNIKEFAKKYANGLEYRFKGTQKYRGEPFWLSEYGGIKYDPTAKMDDDEYTSWGYSVVNTEEEFVKLYVGLTNVLMQNPEMWAFCYTQIYDVEQEENGIYTYDRKCKFSKETCEKIRECNMQIAAIEK